MNELTARYAKALYPLPRGEDALRRAVSLLTGDPALWEALLSPAVRPREKCAVLGRLPELAGQPELLRFLRLLAEKGRLALLPELPGAYHTLALRERGAAECILRCVRVPDAAQREQLKQMLCRLHRRDEVVLDIRTNPALLGGFTLEIEGVTYDKSVRGQLRALSRRLRETKIGAVSS